MNTFHWDKHFTTGVTLVDDQHHRLVDLINRLGESLIAGAPQDDGRLQAVFDDLANYAQVHFADEERLMREAGLDPRYCQHHHRLHVRFVRQLTSMWTSRHAMVNPADVLHGFLRSWLGFHILGEDQIMARQMALINDGVSAADAYDMELSPKDNSTAALLLALRDLYQVLSGQNEDLVAANTRLEDRVAERTWALAEANHALTSANHQLELLSNTDGLLRIANRRYFDLRLEEEWRRALREQRPISLLMIDVDFFKRYNDCYGHQAGDLCLKAVVAAVQPVLSRPSDLLARYGGEELVVILPGTDLSGAIGLAEEMRQALSKGNISHADSPVADRVTISIGAASMYPDSGAEPDRLITSADRGLYLAKAGGRDRVCVG